MRADGASERFITLRVPGLGRVNADARFQALLQEIDTGFGDPLDPLADWSDYPLDEGPPARVLACRPETLFGWKVHGLFERGPGRFRPKDLFDVYLLAAYAPLDSALLPRALRLAFDARGDSLVLTSRRVSARSPRCSARWWRKPRRCRSRRHVAECNENRSCAVRAKWRTHCRVLSAGVLAFHSSRKLPDHPAKIGAYVKAGIEAHP